MQTEYSLLRVRRKTHDLLAKQGEYGDSIDSIIKKLLESKNC